MNATESDDSEAAELAREREIDAVLEQLRRLLLGEDATPPADRRRKLARLSADARALRRARAASATGEPAKPWDWSFTVDLTDFPTSFDLTKFDL